VNRVRARPSSRRAGAGGGRGTLVRATLVALAVVTVAGPARAALLASLVTEVGGVGILAPAIEDPVIAEAVARLRAELRLVGLESQLIGCDAQGAQDARACADERPAGSDTEAAVPAPRAARAGVERAVIALAREDGVMTIEVIERLLNGSKFFRLVYVPGREGGDDPAVLAVRGVELLRDLHMDVERNRAAAAAAPLAAPVVIQPPPPPPRNPGPWRISALAGLLQGRDGLGPRVGPVLGLSRAFGARWAAALLASGPYFQDLAAAGTTDYTSTRQEMALLALRAALLTGRLRPFAVVSGGVFHLVAQGHSDNPAVLTRGRSLWSALFGAGVGAAFALTRFVDLVAQADVLVALPAGRLEVHQDEVVGLAGAPSGLFQLGLSTALP